jgi:hypothetical protein
MGGGAGVDLMVTNYERGQAVEWRARKELKEQGFFVVRAAASKTCVDLVAIGRGMVVLIQLKRSKRNIKSLRAICTSFGKDLAELDAIPVVENVYKELWLWVDRKGWRKVLLDPDGIAFEPAAENGEAVNIQGFVIVTAPGKEVPSLS